MHIRIVVGMAPILLRIMFFLFVSSGIYNIHGAVMVRWLGSRAQICIILLYGIEGGTHIDTHVGNVGDKNAICECEWCQCMCGCVPVHASCVRKNAARIFQVVAALALPSE